MVGLPCHPTNCFGFQGITRFVFVNELPLKSLMRSLYRPPLWWNNENFLMPMCVFSAETCGFSLKWTAAWYIQVTVYWDFFLRKPLNTLWKGLFFFPLAHECTSHFLMNRIHNARRYLRSSIWSIEYACKWGGREFVCDTGESVSES